MMIHNAEKVRQPSCARRAKEKMITIKQLDNDLATMEKQGHVKKAGYAYNRAGDPEQRYELTRAGLPLGSFVNTTALRENLICTPQPRRLKTKCGALDFRSEQLKRCGLGLCRKPKFSRVAVVSTSSANKRDRSCCNRPVATITRVIIANSSVRCLIQA